MACEQFVKVLSVNADLLPTCSLIPPDLHRKIFFCTFADVEECSHSDTPTLEGREQSLITYTFKIWQNLNQEVRAPISVVA